MTPTPSPTEARERLAKRLKAVPAPEWVEPPFDGAFYRGMRDRHVDDELRMAAELCNGDWLRRAAIWLHTAGDLSPPQGSYHHVCKIIADALMAEAEARDALLARKEALVGALSSAAAVIIGVARSFAPGHAPQELVVEAEKIAALLNPDPLPETAEGDARMNAICNIPNCGRSCPAGEAFCSVHRDTDWKSRALTAEKERDEEVRQAAKWHGCYQAAEARAEALQAQVEGARKALEPWSLGWLPGASGKAAESVRQALSTLSGAEK